jgi:hypothetical protein
MGMIAIIQKGMIMKTTIRFAVCIVVMILLWPGASRAGTSFVGVKYWSTSWDSGVLNWLEKDIASSFISNGAVFTADSKPGSGYLAGPLFGYQSDDNKWSVSFAPMVISSFSQDWHGSASTMNLTGTVALERKDYDLAVNYIISKYYKVYAGYKYQDMNIDFELHYDNVMGQQRDIYHLKSQAHIPTIGVGAVYPLTEKLVLGGQLGLLYSIMDLKITNSAGTRENIWPHPGPGFNGELSVTYQLQRTILTQLGYRYQVFTVEARGPGRDTIEKSYDITQGLTFTAMYLF